jgi:hypothetical protein
MQTSNFISDINRKKPLRDKLQADVDAAIAAGKQVTVGKPFGDPGRRPAPITQGRSLKKRLTMKDVVKRYKGGTNGQA